MYEIPHTHIVCGDLCAILPARLGMGHIAISVGGGGFCDFTISGTLQQAKFIKE